MKKMKTFYFRSIAISIVLVYLVIVAGALVRMTGSGMGCPDWPKCFGYYIPPTEISELQFQSLRIYKTGQVIIRDEKLLVANRDFTSAESFRESDWKPYTKHEYAVFNPVHTWIEYLNRLLGALAGLAVLVMAISSFWATKALKRDRILSVLIVFLMGFQGWIGATVVYSVLNPVKITIHMLIALLIVGLLLTLYHRSRSGVVSLPTFSKALPTFALVLLLAQIAMGTQVRQFVDEQVKLYGIEPLSEFLSDGPNIIYIHRSFSIVLFLLAVFIFLKTKSGSLRKLGSWQLAIIFGEVITGILMYYLDFPFGTQAIHLVFASLLFGIYYLMFLRSAATQATA